MAWFDRQIALFGEHDWEAVFDRNHPEYGAGLPSDLSALAGRAFWDIVYSRVADDKFAISIGSALRARPIEGKLHYSEFRQTQFTGPDPVHCCLYLEAPHPHQGNLATILDALATVQMRATLQPTNP